MSDGTITCYGTGVIVVMIRGVVICCVSRVLQGVSDGMIVGVGTEVIAAEGSIVTAGGIDAHIHYICPQQVRATLSACDQRVAVPLSLSLFCEMQCCVEIVYRIIAGTTAFAVYIAEHSVICPFRSSMIRKIRLFPL